MAMTHGGNLFSAAERSRVAWQQVLDFSASINPLGPSPAAREAILTAINRIAHYPEPSGHSLRERLAAEWQITSDHILVGNGATELLFDWCRMFGSGTIAAPAFGEFHRVWPEAGLRQLSEPETWPADGPFVLTRPANPTGTLIDAEVIVEYARGRCDAVLVDESFLDFCDAPSLIAMARGNLYVLRSLTKFWALPGLRIGALVGDVERLAAQRPPWSVNALAAAAALASLDDRQHAERTRAFLQTESVWVAGKLSSLPSMKVWPASANYLYIETSRAAELTRFAASRNVLLRDCTGWPGLKQSAIRVAIRRRWENEILIGLCEECLCG